ncbi:MAG: YaiI/YqxD family protein [Marivibrio sp.]|uniref:YaiI/YqxD family protein n=1 Tax=Marivibrio sp. TaxID=2039719 RepID=UPI0032EF65CF
MPTLYIDADACPVKQEAVRVAERYGVRVVMVSDGGLRPSRHPLVETVVVAQGADAADDWIADRVGPEDVCVTSDIPLADRCLKYGAQAIRPNGELFTQDMIGQALAGRAIAEHRRSFGEQTRGPRPFSKADRSAFLDRLDSLLRPLATSARDA